MRFNECFSYIVADNFIGEGNRSTQRKSPTCRKSLTDFITQCCIWSTPLSSEETVLCWCLHMILYTPVTISHFIDHCHNYVFACLNKKSKIYQEFANFCEINLFICFIFLVTIFFFFVVVLLLDFPPYNVDHLDTSVSSFDHYLALSKWYVRHCFI
jgi:hypothetical protein